MPFAIWSKNVFSSNPKPLREDLHLATPTVIPRTTGVDYTAGYISYCLSALHGFDITKRSIKMCLNPFTGAISSTYSLLKIQFLSHKAKRFYPSIAAIYSGNNTQQGEKWSDRKSNHPTSTSW
jgi:hypothetical protein